MKSKMHLGRSAPSVARRAVREYLRSQRQVVVETAELLTSELVTNALVHGGGDTTLVVDVDDERIRVEVIDLDAGLNLAPLDVDVTAEHGRGLTIVGRLARAWGVEPRPRGKAVWFELDL